MEVEDMVLKHFNRPPLKTPSELINSPVFNPPHRRAAPRRPPREKVVNLTKAPRRVLSSADRQRIIFARYGSLVDFTRVRKSYTEIYQRFRVPLPTVHKLLKMFEARGCNLDNLGRRYERFKMLTPQLRGMLLDEKLLRSWIPLTTQERSAAIFANCGITISPTHLRRFYRQNGVRY